MKKNLQLCALIFVLSSCATTSSEYIFNQKLAKYQNETGNSVSVIKFSNDDKYESEKGVPLKGEPVICKNGQAYSGLDEKGKWHDITLKSNEDIAVTIIISWTNAGWTKTCWPFVSFKPEKDASYVVVNERIGGKGWSALWTGIAFQSCEVSVFKETGESFERIETTIPPDGLCGDLKSKK